MWVCLALEELLKTQDFFKSLFTYFKKKVLQKYMYIFTKICFKNNIKITSHYKMHIRSFTRDG